MIEAYKNITGKYDCSVVMPFKKSCASATYTRGNKFKLSQEYVHYNLRKYSFSNRIIQVWNSLPDSIVEANSVNSFKNRLDKFWEQQDILFNWKAEVTGSGSRSYKFNLV
jgi:hypothetical protein